MDIFHHPDFDDHEEIIFIQDKKVHLKSIVAIHSTILGPALGGTRVWRYEDENAALKDVLRLSKGMTYKASLAGLQFGGGKGVILLEKNQEKTKELLESYARAILRLKGMFLTGEDVGIVPEDVNVMANICPYIRGRIKNDIASEYTSMITAIGVFDGMRAGLHHRLHHQDFHGVTIAIQGLGSVGFQLAKLLVENGADVVGTDIDPKKCSEAKNKLGISIVEPNEIYSTPATIFSPCALGGSINHKIIPLLQCSIIAGAANNQLNNISIGEELRKMHILYAPDYAINAGGIICVAAEGEKYDDKKVLAQVHRIYDTLLKIFTLSDQQGCSTAIIANRLAEERFCSTKLKA